MIPDLLNLKSQIILLIIYLVLLGLSNHSRRLMLFGSCLAVPLAFIQYVYDDVWRADHLFGLQTGIEDFTFCFLIGGISLALVCLFFKNTHFKNISQLHWKRLLVVSFLGIAFLTILHTFGIGNYLNNYISMALTAAILVILQRNLWKVFMLGSVLLVICYIPALNIGFLIWPDLIDLWNIENMSGLMILKVPLEENIWALLFGGTWPMIIFYITKTRVLSRES